MTFSPAGIVDELVSAPSLPGLAIVAVTQVVLAMVKSDTPGHACPR